ncbi:hypothetical protein Psuf_090870 [Phytohabitans suffuscus]|uniref:Uncharacterized protein n=1 Tax=Phytohabitans suffuscus TaxID=624315 RepID=A0A6F8Z0C8_9ACTN|nr:hypothetical protein Psuf_090870 [Phytohabitans suffuscus]
MLLPGVAGDGGRRRRRAGCPRLPRQTGRACGGAVQPAARRAVTAATADAAALGGGTRAAAVEATRARIGADSRLGRKLAVAERTLAESGSVFPAASGAPAEPVPGRGLTPGRTR